GILLFFLIIPPIMLFVKYIKYLIALNDIKTTHGDENLNNAVLFLWISLGINIGLGLLGSVEGSLTFLSLGGFVLTYIAYMKLEIWTNDISLKRNSPKLLDMKEGFSTIKVGYLLSIIIIGIFMIPGGFKRAGRSLMYEFGDMQSGPSSAFQSNMNTVNQSPQININLTNAPPAPNYGQPPSQTFQPSSSTSDSRFCSMCGMEIKDPSIVFCSGCGSKL
ncbi:MAG: hypothetical protein ACTSVZ_11595, partial [Promethearchaeota archaeon]